jgi:hypothetical protein
MKLLFHIFPLLTLQADSLRGVILEMNLLFQPIFKLVHLELA